MHNKACAILVNGKIWEQFPYSRITEPK
jgi:hypothetical protein